MSTALAYSQHLLENKQRTKKPHTSDVKTSTNDKCGTVTLAYKNTSAGKMTINTKF